MLQPHTHYGETPGSLTIIAADNPVGSVPDLQPVVHDFERDRARKQRRKQKKRSELPPETPATPKNPDDSHHVDDYA